MASERTFLRGGVAMMSTPGRPYSSGLVSTSSPWPPAKNSSK
jgi:hypothetical protein